MRAHDQRSGRSSKWITRERRHAIYARDFCACVYCGSDSLLTLDHLKPRSEGGSNKSSNLVTACLRCNSARGSRSVRGFVIATAEYLNRDWRVIMARVKCSARRRVPR